MARRLQSLYPCVERIWSRDQQSMVGAKRWINSEVHSRTIGRLMVGKVITRIVAGAHRLNAKFLQNSMRGKVTGTQKRVRSVPNQLGTVFVEQFADSEISLELKMSPVIKR